VRRLRPKVLLVLDAGHGPLAGQRTLDLRKCPGDQAGTGSYWIVRGHEAGAFGLDPKQFFSS
jgi:hypothetical protein